MGVNGYVSRRQNGTTGYLFKDAHGDVLSIYTSTSNKAADYTYDAWGEIRTKNESSSFENNPLRYYGQYYDYESDMTYLRARYYDSRIRRFITEDQFWNVDNMIYGDEQKTINYAVEYGYKTYYDRSRNIINKEFFEENDFNGIESLTKINFDLKRKQSKREVDVEAILQSTGLYLYCLNNPIKYIDPSGENGVTAYWAGSTFWLAGLDGPLPIGDIIYVGGIGTCIVIDVVGGVMYLAKKAKSSNKEKATDIPSWAKGKKPRAGESGKEFAKRVMDERYGKDNYRTGPGSEYNKLKKYGDRGGN